MAFSKLELLIIMRIADSSEKKSAYDLQDIGWYANVHKSCNRLVELGILKYESVKNEKGAIKKVFRLTSYGFCKYVVEGDLFWGGKKFGELKNQSGYPDDRLDRLDSFLQRWKYLDGTIDYLYTLFLKKKGDGDRLLTFTHTFYLACKEMGDNIEQMYKFDYNLNTWAYATGGKIITEDGEIPARSGKGEKMLFHDIQNWDSTIRDSFPSILIEKFLTYSPRYGISPFFVDFLEIMKNSPDKGMLEQFFKEKMEEADTMNYYYKKSFP
ncbi:MAG: hypothetical protein ABFC78_05640 [Methanoregula sp.]|jgi:hypothetical protein